MESPRSEYNTFDGLAIQYRSQVTYDDPSPSMRYCEDLSEWIPIRKEVIKERKAAVVALKKKLKNTILLPKWMSFKHLKVEPEPYVDPIKALREQEEAEKAIKAEKRQKKLQSQAAFKRRHDKIKESKESKDLEVCATLPLKMAN